MPPEGALSRARPELRAARAALELFSVAGGATVLVASNRGLELLWGHPWLVA